MVAGSVPNGAGDRAFPVDDWTRLDRFLVLPPGKVSPARRLVAPRPAAAGASGGGRPDAAALSEWACRGTASDLLPGPVQAASALGRTIADFIRQS